jgi:hypothetical protein
MRRFVRWELIVVMMIAVTGLARTQGKFGVGLIVGEPTGVAWKYRISGANAVDGAIGLSPGDRARFHVDYLWEKHSFQEENLSLHYGAGCGGFTVSRSRGGDTYVFVRRDLGFAFRGIVGLTYMFPRSPFDAFIEIAPLLIVSPASGMGIDAALGVRLYP